MASDGDGKLPVWLKALNDEDLQFLRRFLLASGSLKQLAAEYGVSYPTIRSRLDRLIAKVRAVDDHSSDDPFELRLRTLVADLKIPASLAKELLRLHQETLNERGET